MCPRLFFMNSDIVIYGEHVAEATLVDDGDGRVVAEGAAKLVDIAMKGVAVAWIITLCKVKQ